MYHAVVLGDDSGRVSLHMYEKVELELSLTPDDMNVFSCPVRVESDPVSPSRYLASHEAGLHQVKSKWSTLLLYYSPRQEFIIFFDTHAHSLPVFSGESSPCV